MTDRNGNESYVRKVSEDTARWTRELLNENQKLRALLARLDAERKHVEDELQHHVETYQRERAGFEQQLQQLEAESRKYLDDYLEVEQQNTNLANLYVASYRLHSTLDRNEVLAGIEEIIINLVGSEELLVCEVTDPHERPRIAIAFGIEARTFEDLAPEVRAKIRECIRTRETWIRDDGFESYSHPLTAAIPMIVDGRATGAIAVFKLLQQKTQLEAVDRELFTLLAMHAATALYCANLHANATAGVVM